MGSSEMQLFEGVRTAGRFDNPEFSMWEKALCFGYKSASFCPDRALHPYVESRKAKGKEYFESTKPKRVTTVRYSDLVN